MKKLLLTLLLAFMLLSLPGCFGGEGEDTNGETVETEALPFFRIVQSDAFQLQVPENWETVQDFSSEYPENIVVAFRNNVKNNDFIANINITTENVPEGTTSRDFALTMIENLRSQLLSYKEIAREDHIVNVSGTEIETLWVEFSGTNDSSKSTRHFIQTYIVKGTTAYIITGSHATDETELAIDQLKTSVRTFTVL